MSHNKEVGMSIVRKKKDFVKIILLMFLPSLHPQPSQVSAGIVLPKEKIRMVFLAISVIFVHKGQSLKPEALF